MSGGGVVHNSPLYNVPPSRERKGPPSAIVVLCSLAVFTCGFWCTLADIRHVRIRTYLHCVSRLRDLQHAGADIQVYGGTE